MRISDWSSDVCSSDLLAEILNTTRPVFAKHGLSLSQFPGFDGALASVTTLIAHKSGGYITAVASYVPAKTDAQGIGSATTYLRRHSAAAAAGIAEEDEDSKGEANNGKHQGVSKQGTERRAKLRVNQAGAPGQTKMCKN